MKKVSLFFVISFLSLALPVQAASRSSEFKGSGEVVTVDPVYSQVTIRHSAIKGFSGDATTNFFVASADMLKYVETGDLVEFEGKDAKGDVRIEKIVKTGVVERASEGSPLGQAVQGVMNGTGEVVRGVTKPLPLVGEVGNAVGDTSEATGEVFKDAPSESRTKF